MNELLTAPAIMAGIGLFFGAVLAVAQRFLKVDEDPRIEATNDMLPGTNCGACGQPGCLPFAEKLVSGESPPSTLRRRITWSRALRIFLWAMPNSQLDSRPRSRSYLPSRKVRANVSHTHRNESASIISASVTERSSKEVDSSIASIFPFFTSPCNGSHAFLTT